MPRQIGTSTLADALFGINSTNHERIVIVAGGTPVKYSQAVIGAVGASGGGVNRDRQVVAAAVAGLARR